MELFDELRAAAASFAAGTTTLERLQDWLAEHTREIAWTGDQRVERLSAEVFLSLAEYEYSHRSESQLRGQLREALRAFEPVARVTVSEQHYATASTSAAADYRHSLHTWVGRAQGEARKYATA